MVGNGNENAMSDKIARKKLDGRVGKTTTHRTIQLPSIDTDWFIRRLADRKLSQRKMAKLLEMDPASVSLMLRGLRKISLEEAAAMANLLGVPVDEVVAHAGIDLPPEVAGSTVPVVGWVDASFEVHMGRPAVGPRRTELPPGMPLEVAALRFVTSATPLEGYDGWVAYYKPTHGVTADSVGRMCIVETNDHLRLLRHVRRGYSPGKFGLTSTVVGSTIEEVKLISAAPVLWMKCV